MERIKTVAIYFDDGVAREDFYVDTGAVLTGTSHGNIFNEAVAMLKNIDENLIHANHTEGFVTTDHRFVDRKEAYRIALAAEQCSAKGGDKRLFSYEVNEYATEEEGSDDAC